jgi:trehalose-6-phosphate synthase
MAPAERAERIARLREGVEREDITWWMRSQLSDLASVARARGR